MPFIENPLERYRVFVTKGHKEAGYTNKDVAANGGLCNLKGKLHCDAALELMSENPSLVFEIARAKVVEYVEECIKYDPNNNYDYSPHH